MKAKVIATNEELATWELIDEMKNGDIVTCYPDNCDSNYFFSQNGYSVPSKFVEVI